MMREISFRKRTAAQWTRNDGEFLSHVTPDTMHREISKLVADGWRIEREDECMLILRKRPKPTLPLFDSGSPELAEEAREMFG